MNPHEHAHHGHPVYAIDEDELRRRLIATPFLFAGLAPARVARLVQRLEALGDTCALAVLWRGTPAAADDAPYPNEPNEP